MLIYSKQHFLCGWIRLLIFKIIYGKAIWSSGRVCTLHATGSLVRIPGKLTLFQLFFNYMFQSVLHFSDLFQFDPFFFWLFHIIPDYSNLLSLKDHSLPYITVKNVTKLTKNVFQAFTILPFWSGSVNPYFAVTTCEIAVSILWLPWQFFDCHDNFLITMTISKLPNNF